MEAQALATTQQQFTRVSREKLIKRLKATKKTHVECYEEALKGWRQQFAVALGKQATVLTELAAKAEDLSTNLNDLERPHLDLPQQPSTHAGEYTKAIARFMMSLDHHIWLSHSEFDTLIMDEWHWKGAFGASIRLYAPPGVYAQSLAIPSFETDFSDEPSED